MYVLGESETVEMNSQYLEILQRHIYLYEDVQTAALLCVVYISHVHFLCTVTGIHVSSRNLDLAEENEGTSSQGTRGRGSEGIFSLMCLFSLLQTFAWEKQEGGQNTYWLMWDIYSDRIIDFGDRFICDFQIHLTACFFGGLS